jgi:hypothetical protein
MKPFDIKVTVAVFLCFLFGLLGMASAYLVLDETHTAYDKLKDFAAPITALVTLTGVFAAAGMALIGAMEKIKFDRMLIKRNAVSHGRVMTRETYHRLSDLHWFVVEIRAAVEGYSDRLPEYISEEIFDTPRRASLKRLQDFAHSGWSRLEKVHDSQRRELSFYVSTIEVACENIYGLADQADNLTKRSAALPTPNNIFYLREKYKTTIAACLTDLEESVLNACSDYITTNPGYDFDHVGAANQS